MMRRGRCVVCTRFQATLGCSSMGSDCYRFQTQHSVGPSRDKQRGQPNADPNTGSQMTILEMPDMTPHLEFSLNTLEHVRIPDVPAERRQRTDVEKEKEMRKRFGVYGPGDRLTKNSSQHRRDMLEEQQDVDGLPWEVRWKKSLIPTSEEVVQDIRDRFDLYIQDPIERAQEWYLHWKDRSFKVQKDRMIWPQGYTDYLDHYDENGRRRVLPTDERWTDTSWRHLADTRYKDRMWLIEGEERRAVHQSLQTNATLMEEEEQRQLELGDVYHGIIGGVVDLDPEQTYEVLAGTADPLEVAKTKMKIQAYGAGQALRGNTKPETGQLDPVSGFPKADMEPLPTGLTVEQGTALATQASIQNEVLEQTAEMARQSGRDPTVAFLQAHLSTSKQHGDRPVLRTQVEAKMAHMKTLQRDHATLSGETANRLLADGTEAIAKMEEDIEQKHVVGMHVTSTVGTHQTAFDKPPTEGFIAIERRPANAEPDIPSELYNVPQSHELSGMPKWYRETLVDTEPLIRSYGMVHDPLEEQQPERAYYVPPSLTEATRITNDDAISGTSSFDEQKMHKLKSMPELVEGYKPLPLFHEVAAEEPAETGKETSRVREGVTGSDGQRLSKSERLRLERQERLRKAKVQYDPDIMLPTLPWETDSIVDPYRGVAKEDVVDFNKADLEATWRAFRGTFQQSITEFGNLTQVTTEDKCEMMLFNTMERFRNGDVGKHPVISEAQEDVFRFIFEAHTKHFLADFYKFKGNRATEANAVKHEADELLRRASAKSKLLGKNFMDFIQEMTALELDTIRTSPVQRHVVLLRDRKYEPIAKPFLKWITNELGAFVQTEFQSVDQLETHRDFLVKHANDAKCKCPARIDGVSDASRDAAVTAFYHWCRGALSFYSGKHLHRMYLEFAETRLRSHAEGHFEDSIEWFCNYSKAARDIVQIPIPDAEPPYEYEEKDFLDGESAFFAEISGHLDKAEGLWHSGTSKRWYPIVDETEYMWYNERRGRLTLAMDISDRCLENVNKKTHPSIHPFPERARKFLEGAPLTQETAEHLWLRYMGDLYKEHSEFMFRQGRFHTARSYHEKSLNLFHMAVRTAKERLPPSWKAPLLTEAKYLLHAYEPGQDVLRHLAQVEVIVNRLFSEKEPPHWVDPFTELPHRLAVVHANLPAYGESITKAAVHKLQWQPSNELLMKCIEQRAQGGAYMPELEGYFATVSEVADGLFRQKILRWRAMEREGSDAYLFWTHLYFTFRVHPKDEEEVGRMWDMYEPAFLYIYTQCALALRMRGQRLINDALRRICQILLAGNLSHKRLLLDELTKVREKLTHLIDRVELDRTINALDAHMANPTNGTYTYGSAILHRDTLKHERIVRNPLLRSSMSAADYAELQKRQQDLRVHGSTADVHDLMRTQDESGGDEPLGSQPEMSTREMCKDVP